MIRILAFANQQLGIDCLEILTKTSSINLLGVVGCETVKDIKQGYPSVKSYCKRRNLKYFNPLKLDDEFLRVYSKLNPDLCFGFMYRNIFNKKFLEIPKMGIINFHPSLLPKYRGQIPWVWAMLNGEEEVGLTMHYMDEGVDTGDIIAQSKVRIGNDTSGYELISRIMKSGSNLFKKNLPEILAGKNKRVKQNHSLASYYGAFNEKIRYINWLDKGDLIIRRINALTHPYKGAVALIEGKEILIWKAKRINRSKKLLRGPGRIVEVREDAIIVTTVDGFLEIVEYGPRKFSKEKNLSFTI